MYYRIFLTLLSISVFFVSCEEDDDKGFSITAGDSDNAYYHKTITPKTILNPVNGKEEIPFYSGGREQLNDLKFVSINDTTIVADTIAKITTTLTIEPIDSLPYNVYIASDTSEIKIYDKGENIYYYRQKWFPLLEKSNKILSSYSKDFQNKRKVTIAGAWNDMTDKYFGILTERENSKVISWIKIDVSNYKSITYHDQASFIIE